MTRYGGEQAASGDSGNSGPPPPAVPAAEPGAAGSRAIPPGIRAYLERLVGRVEAVYGRYLTGVYAVGSLALGDYRHGRSDIDIAVVVAPVAPGESARELARVLAHPEFHCPAAGLELVVYDADFAATPSPRAGYLLNLNTGAALPEVADLDSGRAPDFWFVIDRAIAYQSGLVLAGPPAREVLAAPRRDLVLAAIGDSVREHATAPGHPADNRVLNGCRSVVFCRTGRWTAKRAAARVIAASEPRFRALVVAAVRSFERPRGAAETLPAAAVGDFSAWVAQVVAAAQGATR
ncbi:nucleotidyltransferase domain-containing protein [Nocardia sp. NPDC024068]|uniref:nucleotidyltransferase domain-containing protein n=1 Tax=Nocardia sp. NPDC024068 TaxID=3157197 RepID=UPI0033C26E1B